MLRFATGLLEISAVDLASFSVVFRNNGAETKGQMGMASLPQLRRALSYGLSRLHPAARKLWQSDYDHSRLALVVVMQRQL
jgi:hypothetical protein